MTTFIDNVGAVQRVDVTNSGAVIKSMIGKENRIEADKYLVRAEINETISIALKWTKFSEEEEDWIDNIAATAPFEVKIADTVIEVLSSEGIVQFTSEEQGEYVIETVNAGVDNCKVVILVE